MAYDINSALLRLEKNLIDLESARTQVENAVKGSNDLQKVVSEYVGAVESLCTKLKKWDTELDEREGTLSRDIETTIQSLHKSCSQIISTFNSSVNEKTTEFKNQTESEIVKYSQQNDRLDGHIKNLITLRDDIKNAVFEISKIKETIEDISKKFEDSQAKQNDELQNIKSKLSEMPSLVDGAVETIIDKIDVLNRNIKSFLDFTKGKFEEVNGKINGLANDIYSINNQCVAIQSSIQTSFETLKTAIEESEKAIKLEIEQSNNKLNKSSNINRWIIIIGIIILAVLQFVIK